jgi:hypothetical protein
MQYLLMICHDDAFRPTPALIADIHAWIGEMDNRGIRVCGNPLRPSGEAVTVRMREGKLTRTRGPFARSKEKMCAYELIECASVDEAIGVAAGHPMAKVATIEVRPVWTELREGQP